MSTNNENNVLTSMSLMSRQLDPHNMTLLNLKHVLLCHSRIVQLSPLLHYTLSMAFAIMTSICELNV